MRHTAALTFAGLALACGHASHAQVAMHDAERPVEAAGFDTPQPAESSHAGYGWAAASSPKLTLAYPHPGQNFYAGADYLLIRPHFSEAIGFVEAVQTPSSYQTVGRDLSFDYDSAFRLFAGVALNGAGDEVRFTYTSIDGETDVDGAAGAPGTFLVDPFGNIVGAGAVIDPHSRLFGQILPGGDQIETFASVELDVYDFEFVRPFRVNGPCSSLTWSAGIRVADVDQFYSSDVSLAGMPLAHGDFSVDYLGVGPRLGLRGDHRFGKSGFSVFAQGHGSLLVGEYEVGSSNTLNLPTTFRAAQQENLTRLVPVLETELGAAYQFGDRVRVSGGWLFQSWLDMGTSGGTFGGFFAGADDANNMSFDGLMLRAEVGF